MRELNQVERWILMLMTLGLLNKLTDRARLLRMVEAALSVAPSGSGKSPNVPLACELTAAQLREECADIEQESIAKMFDTALGP